MHCSGVNWPPVSREQRSLDIITRCLVSPAPSRTTTSNSRGSPLLNRLMPINAASLTFQKGAVSCCRTVQQIPCPASPMSEARLDLDDRRGTLHEANMKAAQVMTFGAATIKPEASIREAARTMLDYRISGLPVVDDEGNLV